MQKQKNWLQLSKAERTNGESERERERERERETDREREREREREGGIIFPLFLCFFHSKVDLQFTTRNLLELFRNIDGKKRAKKETPEKRVIWTPKRRFLNGLPKKNKRKEK
jgi:hypothetical protein